MNRFKTNLAQMISGVSVAILRFPFSVFCLASTAVILCYMISLHHDPSIWVQKFVYSLIVGALLGMLAQFSIERFERLSKRLFFVYACAVLLTFAYLGLIWPTPEMSNEITIRSLVAVFAMVCIILWLPAFHQKAAFNQVALIHFKSLVTSVLYSAVIFGGVSAILFAIDSLLFGINTNSYAYVAVIIWVVFAPIYDLALLPHFNPKTDTQKTVLQEKSQYGHFLDILASYIAIPLFTAYTLVLLVYIVKIMISRVWPIGLLGPMVLIYSAIGIVLFVLSSLSKNRISILFRTVFPKVWIPIILMQMISVWIRLNAYGITESRYYVSLFAIFSLTSAIILSIWPQKKTQNIALLGAAFALLSILPPMDAFTLSRNSQIHRLEAYLTSEGMLAGQTLTAKSTASLTTKIEVTNILTYLDRHHSLKYISWLPDEFERWRDMQTTFGFEQTWPSNAYRDPSTYWNATLNTRKALDISGHQVAILARSDRTMLYYAETDSFITEYNISINGIDYLLSVERTSAFDVSVILKNQASEVLVSANLQHYFDQLQENLGSGIAFTPEQMTFAETKNDYQLTILFETINATLTGSDIGADYDFYILIKVP